MKKGNCLNSGLFIAYDEFSKRHEYLLDKLKLEEELWLKKHDNADNVVDDVVDNSARLEKPLIPKKSK